MAIETELYHRGPIVTARFQGPSRPSLLLRQVLINQIVFEEPLISENKKD
jgi:hypothetical protein